MTTRIDFVCVRDPEAGTNHTIYVDGVAWPELAQVRTDGAIIFEVHDLDLGRDDLADQEVYDEWAAQWRELTRPLKATVRASIMEVVNNLNPRGELGHGRADEGDDDGE